MNKIHVEVGSFKHSIEIAIPSYYSEEAKQIKPFIYIDKCILKEIKYLWKNKIKTAGSCCGHGKIFPSVAVFEESIEDMYKLGYKNDPNYLKKNRKDIFLLKGKL